MRAYVEIQGGVGGQGQTNHPSHQKYLPAYFNKLVIIALQNLEKKVRARSVEMTNIFPQNDQI